MEVNWVICKHENAVSIVLTQDVNNMYINILVWEKKIAFNLFCLKLNYTVQKFVVGLKEPTT